VWNVQRLWLETNNLAKLRLSARKTNRGAHFLSARGGGKKNAPDSRLAHPSLLTKKLI